eukprot:SAG22_NODE_3685_length_1578_cov_1.314865_1_plen_349_part_00
MQGFPVFPLALTALRPPSPLPSPVSPPRSLRALGEIPRLMLAISGTKWTSAKYFGKGEYKDAGKLSARGLPAAPFGQMPLLKHPKLGAGKCLAQSGSITRFLSEQHGGSGSVAAAGDFTDMVFECAKDLLGAKAAVYGSADAKMTARFAQFAAASAALLGEKDWFSGGAKPDYGDVGMFHTLNTIFDATKAADGASSFLDSELAGMAALKAFWARTKEVPELKAYLASELCIPLTDNETGKAPWQPNGYRYQAPLLPASYATPAYAELAAADTPGTPEWIERCRLAGCDPAASLEKVKAAEYSRKALPDDHKFSKAMQDDLPSEDEDDAETAGDIGDFTAAIGGKDDY